jgi:hypothetical protein
MQANPDFRSMTDVTRILSAFEQGDGQAAEAYCRLSATGFANWLPPSSPTKSPAKFCRQRPSTTKRPSGW